MHSHHHQISLGFTPELFPEGTHICYLYNDGDERMRVVSAYLKSGMAQHESVGYFPDVLTSDLLEKELEKLDIAILSQQQTHQYKVTTALDAYCPDGRFDPDRTIAQMRDLYEQSAAAGFSGARISGEMTWALRGIPGAERLIEYEALLNKFLVDSPLTMICQFDTARFDGATIFDILNVHPMMIVRGQVIHNPYYVPANEYLRMHGGAQRAQPTPQGPGADT
jgi:hypothetical protein